MRLTNAQRKVAMAMIAVFCGSVLLVAWQLQYGSERQQPCPLCILQRYAYLSIALIALAGAIHGRAQKYYAAAISLNASAGFGFAVWQLAKGAEMTTCRSDPIGVFVNALPTAQWWPEYLFATGGCADKYPPLFGVSIPAWSLLCFMGLVGVAILIARREREQSVD